MTENKIQKIQNAPKGFCLAKWYQVTIDLSRGYTHSCHHPERHKIPLDELALDPSALHNTQYKMLQRKTMLEGGRPAECEYCWKIEDTSTQNVSDRFIKSSDDWAYPHLDKTISTPWNQPVSPTYLEVIFSSECNLNCAYCMADVSTSIEKEMLKHGPYPVVSNQHRMPTEPEIKGDNPYIKAFWLWFPTILEDLKIFRITGGEPLLSKQTFLTLDYLESHPAPNLELALNTNLSYSSVQLEKFLAKVKILLAKKAIKSFTLFTSLDAFGNEAFYIRHGLNFDRFIQNIDIISSSLPESPIIIMCTFNILSISSFRNLLDWISDKKQSGCKITLDISYLKEPQYLRVSLADLELQKIMNEDLLYMKTLVNLSKYEIQKFERIINWINSSFEKEETRIFRSDFYAFINEYDRRHGISFINSFPSYENFFKLCKKANIWSKYFNQQVADG
jgi:organic radical activating enzyme